MRGERRTVAAAESRSLAGDCRPSLASPSQRRARMAKSLSQDTGCCLTEASTTTLPSSTRWAIVKSRMAFQEVFELIYFVLEVVIDLNVWKYFVEHDIT